MNKFVSTVILASNGYPNSYKKGDKINNLEEIDESIIFHAGTKNNKGNIESNGGRVLAATGFGKLLKMHSQNHIQLLIIYHGKINILEEI